MGVYKYKRQEWNNYDKAYDMETNMEVGGVITVERLDHIEEGLVHANMPIIITITPSEEDVTIVEEKKDKKYIEVLTPTVEPKHSPLNITLVPGVEKNKTEVRETDKERKIIIDTSTVEPRWPDKLEITLAPDKKDDVIIKDEGDTRKIMIRSSFLNTCAIKPSERDIVVDIEDWTGEGPYEAILNIEAEITPSSFVRVTRGSEITREQMKAIRDCNIKVYEDLDGSFKVTATTMPDIDIPFHVAIL